jgi:DNA repair photolyase
MPLTKVKAGSNMYQEWISHTHTHIGGECPHKCSYCYVQAMEKRFKGGRYAGELRLIEKEFDINYGSGRTIFIEHCNDMWAAKVPDTWIRQILKHCRTYPDNIYVFQTKHPRRYHNWLKHLPEKSILGCTIESDNVNASGHVPSPKKRVKPMYLLPPTLTKFITIEPILKGNMRTLANWIKEINPAFVNIGADSKGAGLKEPTAAEVLYLIKAIKKNGIEIKQKRNLYRLLNTNSL